MEVILLENIKKLGSIGQKVKVKDGYGRNFLIKKNKALLANKKNMEIFKKRKDEITKKNELEKAESQEIAKKLRSLKLEIKKEAMENKQLYGSVSVKEIVNLLNSNNIKISAEKIEIKNQIKSLGTHKVYINLHAEVQSNVDIEIKPIS
ncbi:MAG: 50S ribosomal protein L9 [Candidatus Pelagibacter sp.]|nr:50S ribosomal protein L9 [Candidatus Pelagibacter sp.]|tara:strand:+ start:20272 stop:20718 length:447 start_codon:yes stop_codon:yes gene_type:complete